MAFQKFISKELITTYPISQFNGEIIIIDKEQDVYSACSLLIKEKIFLK